jgi:hypothetical protein
MVLEFPIGATITRSAVGRAIPSIPLLLANPGNVA